VVLQTFKATRNIIYDRNGELVQI
jgi:hypothetical protein